MPCRRDMQRKCRQLAIIRLRTGVSRMMKQGVDEL
jgi:hypothetical protein